MVSRASWEKLQYTIAEGTNANTVRVLLASRYPLILSDLTEAQETTLRGATLTATPAVVELFICACAQGNLAWVCHLLAICGASCENDFHRTPIDAAAEGGHIDVLEFLLQNGSRIRYTTCVMVTIMGRAEALELLLSRVDSDGFDMDMLTQRLLRMAVLKECPSIVPLLTAHGADVTSPFGPHKKEIETYMGRRPSREMMAILQREGACILTTSSELWK